MEQIKESETMDNQPKISVIVPVYNVEKYLRRCIDSILEQTFTDFEVLLIDDGSTDTSGNICDEYAEKDERVRVFHKKNGGVSSARNIGLDNARGEWICFADSDDYVGKNWLKKFSNNFAFDIVIQSFYATNWFGNQSEIFIEMPFLKGFTPDDFRELYMQLYKKWNIGFIWCRAFKRSIIVQHSIRFNINYSLREDELFIFQYMKYIHNFSSCSNGCYHYLAPDYDKKYQNDISVLTKLKFMNEIIESKKEVIGSYNNQLIKIDINIYAGLIYELGTLQPLNSNLLNDYIEEFRKYMRFLNDLKGISLKAKLLYKNALLFIRLRNIIKK